MTKPEAEARNEFVIRSFRPGDQAEVDRLAREGLLIGHIDHSGCATPADPHGSGAGLPTPKTFWIVEVMGRVMGTIALLQEDCNVGRLLQLRVAPEWQSKPAVARILVGAAIDEAKKRGAMKVIIESPNLEVPGVPPGDSPIITHLRSLGFQHARNRSTDGRSMLEFYLNLYDDPSMTVGSNEMPHRP
jgi:hypothetical protein